MYSPPQNGPVDQLLLDAQVDEALEGMMHLGEVHDLHIMTVSLRHYADFPRDENVGRQVLAQLATTSPKPDVICVQEGLDGVDPLGAAGYRRLVSSTSRARPLKDVVYGNVEALSMIPENRHDNLSVNEIYVRDGSPWEVAYSGVAPISTDLFLEHTGGDSQDGEAGCEYWPLAIRTVVWGKFVRRAQSGPHMRAFVFCSRLSGGGFEDQFFLKQIADERQQQVERILKVAAGQAGPGDLCVLVGDFGGALPEDATRELLGSSLDAVLAGPSAQAQVDQTHNAMGFEEMQRRFRTYAVAPLVALRTRGWHTLPCDRAPLGAFGHDHPGVRPAAYVATSQAITIKPQAAVATSWRREVWPRVCDSGYVDRGIAKVTLVVRQAAGDEGNCGGPFGQSNGGEGPHVTLQREHRELVREHRAEQEASEEMQLRLSAEMMELRDSCHEKGQAISTLTCRLAETAEAVTSELQGAAVVRHELEVELAREEATRRDLEATLGTEEGEAASRVQASEQQLQAMQGVRASLEAQIRTSFQIQAELSDHIAAERNGRAELEVAGERELLAWREHNARVRTEIQHRLENEKSEVSEWRASTENQVIRLREESEQHSHEESELLAELSQLREAQVRDRTRLQGEASLWQQEVEILNTRVQEVDEECKGGDELHQRLNEERAICASEKEELEEELRKVLEQRGVADKDLQLCDESSKELHQELSCLKESVNELRHDDVTTRLYQERDELRKEIHDESQQKSELEAELANASRGVFSCFRRRPPRGTSSPLPPPEGPPPKASKEASKTPPSAKSKGVQGRRVSQQGASKPDKRDQSGSEKPQGGDSHTKPPPPPASSTRGAAGSSGSGGHGVASSSKDVDPNLSGRESEL
eukprot:TRINITY_DN68547_c0_g1_i1.p1 TRINITY_DN68547_c0_g1~~TRINITY_DN68547_c0_g1_i1.p1  ORF type:complete len:876 (+),score=189.72 TRINITY_DN68547_c0_g1_i1:315-2942(+)